MSFTLSIEWIITAVCTAISTYVALSHKNLKTELDALKESNDKEHDNFKQQIHDQGKNVTESHDAIIKLTTLMEKLDQTLTDFKKTMENMVTVSECEFRHKAEKK